MGNTSDFCRWLDEQRHRGDAVGRIAKVIAYRRNFPRHSDRLSFLLKQFETEPDHRALLRHAHRTWRRMRSTEQEAV